MGKATGVFLILAGLGTAALVLPNVDKDAEQQIADAVRAATGGAAPTGGRAVAALPAPTIVPVPRPLARPAVTAAPAPGSADKPATATATVDYGRPPVLIAPPQAIVRNAVAAPNHVADGQARQGLARDIQRELKRVGCYDGEVTGEWSANTRQAMKTFIDRVNAALPVDEPDHILRTMVQGHPGHACGVGCPSGQTSQQGRCRPSGIIAQAPAPRSADGLRPRDAATPAQDVAAVRPSVPRPAWETTVATAPSAPPAQVNLEGRMAIGAQLPGGTNGQAAARPGVIVLAPAADPRRAAVARAPAGGLAGIIVPGAIAAFGGPPAATGSIRPGMNLGAAGLNPGALPLPADGTQPETIAPPGSNGTRVTGKDGQPQAVRRERPTRTYSVPKPAKFTFPAPSYLIGGTESKYAPSGKKSTGSPFSHFFEWQARNGGP